GGRRSRDTPAILDDERRHRSGDDLDTPAVLALVDAWSESALAAVGDDAQAPALMAQTVDALLGIRL
ncbi:cysteine--1-D-myo-inosityl 2-amino-2-deoxy-alpha-D-glucopyranoside ligase, partial [Actinoplanes sp. NPDC026623]